MPGRAKLSYLSLGLRPDSRSVHDIELKRSGQRSFGVPDEAPIGLACLSALGHERQPVRANYSMEIIDSIGIPPPYRIGCG